MDPHDMIRVHDMTSIRFSSLTGGDRPPVIMQVVPALNSGGVEQGVVDISNAIVRAGGRSIVVSSGGMRVPEILRGGALHVELPVHSKNPLTMMANVGALERLIRQHGVDVVHACSRAPAWSAGRAARRAKALYVTSCHAAHASGGPLKRFYNSAIAGGEIVIAVSHFLANWLEHEFRLDPARIRVVHRGLALEKFHPNAVTPDRLVGIAKKWRVPDGASVVMLPGRLSRIKGHMFLIDALVQLGRDDLFCVFVGNDPDGNYRRELETYIESKGFSGRARIVDHCDDMPAAYMISTVVTAPSLVPEGFGRIAIEAQAMGRPLIVTDHGGARETVLRDETGWLVKPGDTHALAQALAEAMALSDRQRAILATRAMAHVAANFTVETMCAQTLDVYAEVMERAGRNAASAAAHRPDARRRAVGA